MTAAAGARVQDSTDRELTLQTVGGRQPVHEHRAAEPIGVVAAILPALGIRASYYEPFADRLAAGGVHVLRTDYPGHGDSPIRAGRGCNWGYGDLVRTHGAAFAALAKRRWPDCRFVWIGHSIGGQLALMHAGLHPGAVDACAVIATGSPHWRSWRPAYGVRVLGSAWTVRGVTHLLGHHPGERMGFGGREPALLMQQWAAAVHRGRFLFDGFDGDAALLAYDRPLLAVRIAGDDWAPEASLRRLLSKTAVRQLTTSVWHAGAGIGHNNWPRTPDEVAGLVLRWYPRAFNSTESHCIS